MYSYEISTKFQGFSYQVPLTTRASVVSEEVANDSSSKPIRVFIKYTLIHTSAGIEPRARAEASFFAVRLTQRCGRFFSGTTRAPRAAVWIGEGSRWGGGRERHAAARDRLLGSRSLRGPTHRRSLHVKTEPLIEGPSSHHGDPALHP